MACLVLMGCPALLAQRGPPALRVQTGLMEPPAQRVLQDLLVLLVLLEPMAQPVLQGLLLQWVRRVRRVLPGRTVPLAQRALLDLLGQPVRQGLLLQ